LLQLEASAASLTFQEWRTWLAAVLRRVGCAAERIVVSLSDWFINEQLNSQLSLQIMEDINALLTYGCVPNLYTNDELNEVHF
jgi:hypothetical protein